MKRKSPNKKGAKGAIRAQSIRKSPKAAIKGLKSKVRQRIANGEPPLKGSTQSEIESREVQLKIAALEERAEAVERSAALKASANGKRKPRPGASTRQRNASRLHKQIETLIKKID